MAEKGAIVSTTKRYLGQQDNVTASLPEGTNFNIIHLKKIFY